jgi:multidrug resistance protein, MATE family
MMDGWVREARAVLGIACAVSAAMAAQIGMDAVELALAARLGAAALAGVTLAGGVYSLVFMVALGVVTAVTPLAAREAGRGDAAALARVGRNGMWVALGVAVPLALAMVGAVLLVPPQAFGPGAGEAATLAAARRFLLGAAPGLPGWVVYVALRCLAVGSGRAHRPLAVMAAALPAYAALGWALAAGSGVAGLGIAATAIGWAAAGAAAAWEGVSGGMPDRAGCAAILRLGLPFALRIVLREGVLPAAALLLVPFGAVAVAAHGLAARVVMLAGVFSFGFSDASNARVGRALGAGTGVRRVGVVSLVMATAVSLAAALAVAARPRWLAGLVLGPGDPAVVAAAASLLPVAAVLLFLEGVQSAGSGALQGMRDARVPLAIAVLGGWVVGLPAGFLLAAWLAVPVVGLWAGLCLGWAIAATLTLDRFRRMSRRSGAR